VRGWKQTMKIYDPLTIVSKKFGQSINYKMNASTNVIEKLDKMKKKMNKLEKKIHSDRWFDCIISAKMIEELDAISNGKKEDRVIITGLNSTSSPPKVPEEKKKWLEDVVKDLLKKIHPESTEKILFVNQGRNHGK
jgi:hypothetical protein